jgi:hypothetical protein
LPRETIEAFLRTFIGCLVGKFTLRHFIVGQSEAFRIHAETVAFHAGIMLACYFTLNLLGKTQLQKKQLSTAPISGIRQEFRFAAIFELKRTQLNRSRQIGTYPIITSLFLNEQTLSSIPIINLATFRETFVCRAGATHHYHKPRYLDCTKHHR